MLTLIWLRTEFVGFHHWENAPEEVGYLRNGHRHLFKIYVELYVHHPDRAVEFHTVKKKVDTYLSTHAAKHGTPQSCEMIAVDIAVFLYREGYQVSEVDVSEDGECGGKVIYDA